MKKLLFLSALFISFSAYSQVGINTETPQASLEILATNATGNTTDVEGLLIPRVDRQRVQSMTGVTTSTLIYVNDITTGTATGTAVNIDAPGYYYFDETNAWTKLKTSVNDLEDSGVVSLSTLALKNSTYQPNTNNYDNTYGYSNWAVIDWETTPKIDNTKLTYNDLGKFTVKKAGYYQILTSTHLNMSLNPERETSGTAQTVIKKNNTTIASATSSHGERTNNVYHTVAGAAYFNVDDTISVEMVMTRRFRIAGGDSFITITYLGQ